MTGQFASEIYQLIDFHFPGSDLVAVLPYVIPLLFLGLVLLLYQRYMDHESMRRNLVVFIGIILILISALLIVYGGYGSYWWGPDELTMGSWQSFVAGLQWMTDALFGSVIVGTIYVVIIGIVFVFVAIQVISPPNPDFEKLNGELKAIRAEYEQAQKSLKELEVENKKLHEFISEKEAALVNLDAEVSALKKDIEEREAQIAKMQEALAAPAETSEMEQDLLETINAKEKTIGDLQDKIAQLEEELRAKSTAPTIESDVLTNLRTRVQELEAKIEEYQKRSSFATDVLDSVVTEFGQLNQQISSGAFNDQTQKVLSSLLQAMGTAIDRLVNPPKDKPVEEPRIELIGAVIIMHEIVDTVKKIIREFQ